MENHPGLWLSHLPFPKAEGNKYDRGHAVVLGGPISATGASRLAARAALRAGAGLVSLACDPASLIVYATALEAIMTRVIKDEEAFADLLTDKRITAVLLGPAAGLTERTRTLVLTALKARKACVLDADALSVFKDEPEALFAALTPACVLTPHEGEFTRLFGRITNRPKAAIKAAKTSDAVILLKGSETVIAAPDGRLCVNPPASPWLATAGSGDVLAGIITGLLAQGMPAFEAACAGVWMHAEAARAFGPGLIAEDLSEQLPAVWAELQSGYWGGGVTPGFHG